MNMQAIRGWGDVLLGILVGGALAFGTAAAINFTHGWQRVGAWQRALDDRQSEVLEQMMLSQIERAGETALDGDPSDLSDRMASSVFPSLYRLYLDQARYLLENNHVDRFNELRALTEFAVLDLSNADLAGLDLQNANFAGAVLNGADFSRAHLGGASFFRARLATADFSHARVTGTTFAQADLGGAWINAISGSVVDFRDAILVNTSLTGIVNLTGARFDGATLVQSNLHASSFPEAVFDGADMTLVSAINCDFSEVAGMNKVILTGANLAGARLNLEHTSYLWLHNAEGLSDDVVEELRAHHSVDRPERLLTLIDSRIVAGFRTQLDENIKIDPGEKRALLLDLLRQYWMQ